MIDDVITTICKFKVEGQPIININGMVGMHQLNRMNIRNSYHPYVNKINEAFVNNSKTGIDHSA